MAIVTTEIEAALAREADGLWAAMQEAVTAQAAALAAAAGMVRLSTNREAALQKAMAREGWAPVSDEFDWEHGGRRYVGQWGEDFVRDGLAVWFCVVGEWDRVQYAEASRT